MIVAFSYTNDAGEATQERAVVTDLANMTVGIVCVYHPDNDQWEPVYMLKRPHEGDEAVRVGLPSCFLLNDEAVEALKHVMLIHHDESGEVR